MRHARAHPPARASSPDTPEGVSYELPTIGVNRTPCGGFAVSYDGGVCTA